jgi:hypothetical protein
LLLNDDANNIHKKKSRERDLKNLRGRMFNDINIGFERVED